MAMITPGIPAAPDDELLLGTTAQGVSSTEIRERTRAKLPTRYLTPDRVLDYIREHKLYENKAVPVGDAASQAGERIS